MGMTFEKNIVNLKTIGEYYSRDLCPGEYEPLSEDELNSIDIAVDIMRKYQKIINDYEKLSDSLEKSGASPKVCSKKIDKFCIDTMKEILCDYYTDVLHEEIEDGNDNR